MRTMYSKYINRNFFIPPIYDIAYCPAKKSQICVGDNLFEHLLLTIFGNTKKIIQEHGGVIEYESEPGQGTVFRIRLPRSRLPEPPVENEESAATRTG